MLRIFHHKKKNRNINLSLKISHAMTNPFINIHRSAEISFIRLRFLGERIIAVNLSHNKKEREGLKVLTLEK